MKSNIVLIVLGEPNSIFSEVLFKYFKSEKFKKIKKKIILIGNYKLLLNQMKKLKFQIKLNKISEINNALKHFLKKKFPGITEYIANETNSPEPVMLIYNKNLAVNPLTTHIPIKNVSNFIKKKKIIYNVKKINNFYKLNLKKKPNIAILGLNPHCESTDRISEEKKEIYPAIKYLKKHKIKVIIMKDISQILAI